MSQDKPKPASKTEPDETEPAENRVEEARPAAEPWEALMKGPAGSNFNPDYWPKP